ncbi:MAG: SWIM zinc finger family protein [Desulfovibrionaceae bacterium]|nr:SWIM zinc finger family protein [Desulfovibrionaceae bacterium]
MPYGFPTYVSVQEKIKKAEKMLAKLQAKGMQLHPVAAFTGTLAKTFWGKSWCTNLEHYADFANRLPRGRDYVRHGCVCHLEIKAGEVRAKVLGSSLYDVAVHIATLPARRWQALCAGCAGQIATLIDLLRGKLSSEIMTVICDPATGMFPSPKEIRFSCSCPDSARMCKHVAAALYGVGRRLDAAPEELFTLRGVNAADLLPPTLNVAPAAMPGTLQVEDMGALFGIDLQMDVPRPDSPSK